MTGQTLKFALFFSIMLSVFFGSHLYIFSRLAYYFSFDKNFTFYFVATFFALFYLISALIEKLFSNQFTRII